jgi:hypothetical protein
LLLHYLKRTNVFRILPIRRCLSSSSRVLRRASPAPKWAKPSKSLAPYSSIVRVVYPSKRTPWPAISTSPPVRAPPGTLTATTGPPTHTRSCSTRYLPRPPPRPAMEIDLPLPQQAPPLAVEHGRQGCGCALRPIVLYCSFRSGHPPPPAYHAPGPVPLPCRPHPPGSLHATTSPILPRPPGPRPPPIPSSLSSHLPS